MVEDAQALLNTILATAESRELTGGERSEWLQTRIQYGSLPVKTALKFNTIKGNIRKGISTLPKHPRIGAGSESSIRPLLRALQYGPLACEDPENRRVERGL